MFDFYKELGDVFKQKYKGWTAWVLSGNLDAMKKVGLKASQKHHVYNGALECTYNKYEMY
jgi:putative N6-adenine-specific DNA methylase